MQACVPTSRKLLQHRSDDWPTEALSAFAVPYFSIESANSLAEQLGLNNDLTQDRLVWLHQGGHNSTLLGRAETDSQVVSRRSCGTKRTGRTFGERTGFPVLIAEQFEFRVIAGVPP